MTKDELQHQFNELEIRWERDDVSYDDRLSELSELVWRYTQS